MGVAGRAERRAPQEGAPQQATGLAGDPEEARGFLGTPGRLAQLSWVGKAALVLGAGLALGILPLKLAGGLVAGLAALVAILLRPAWGLYPLVLSIPFSPLARVSLGSVNLSSTELLAGLVICGWLAAVAVRRKMAIQTPLLRPFGLFLGLLLVSLVGATSFEEGFKEIVKWLEVLLVYLFVANEIEEREARRLLLFIVVVGCMQAILGLYQFIARAGPEGFLFPIAGRLWLRAYGSFGQPNPYAGYLGLVLPIAYGLVFSGRPGESRGMALSWLVGLAGLALMAPALLATLSRGAWLGFAAAVAVMTTVRSRRGLLLLVGLALASVVVLSLAGRLGFVQKVVVERLMDFRPYLSVDIRRVEVTPENWAVVERLAHWHAAWGMFADHPLLGVGIGNYPVAHASYALPGWEDPLGHAHNYYLNLLAETGLLGLGTYLMLLGAIFWRAWGAWRASRGYWQGIAAGLLGVLSALAVHSLFDNLYVQGMNLQVALVVGLVCAIGSGFRKEPQACSWR